MGRLNTMPLPKATATTADEPRGFVITLRNRPQWLLVGFMSFWLIAWTAGGIAAFTALIVGGFDSGGSVFLLGWLGMWAVAECFVAFVVINSFAGRETTVINGTTLIIKRSVGRFERVRVYDLSEVRDLRPAPSVGWAPPDRGVALEFWGIGGGRIAFDYGARTFRFAARIDEAEAKQIVADIKRRYQIS